jgi:hypothetical protein
MSTNGTAPATSLAIVPTLSIEEEANPNPQPRQAPPKSLTETIDFVDQMHASLRPAQAMIEAGIMCIHEARSETARTLAHQALDRLEEVSTTLDAWLEGQRAMYYSAAAQPQWGPEMPNTPLEDEITHEKARTKVGQRVVAIKTCEGKPIICPGQVIGVELRFIYNGCKDQPGDPLFIIEYETIDHPDVLSWEEYQTKLQEI